jgi:hypothetical protein
MACQERVSDAAAGTVFMGGAEAGSAFFLS